MLYPIKRRNEWKIQDQLKFNNLLKGKDEFLPGRCFQQNVKTNV
jgi:hypothetical protein